MNTYPAFEAELEKALRDDKDGTFVKDLQRSLGDFVAAVEFHTRDGVTQDQYRQWQDLKKAAEKASEAAEEVHLRLHDN